MMSRLIAAMVALVVSSSYAQAAEPASQPTQAKTYTLRYQFHPGETLKWNVVHRCQIRTSVSGTTKTAETTTGSVKVWRVREVRPDGSATFEHMVEEVDMRHRLSGRDELHYNSTKDLCPPPGFEQIRQAIGVPLATVTLDTRGHVLSRKQNPLKAAVEGQGEMTIPLPAEPIAVGGSWSYHQDVDVPMQGGGSRRIKTLQSLTLESVQTGVATIARRTQILTPISDPAIESQLLQNESSGTVKFDLDTGRILSQQIDVDKGVVGFRGEASSIRYQSRSTEEIRPVEKVAARPATKG